MAISRLSTIRQLLPGARQPEQDERLLQLFWNRAELKKELTRLQDERLKLLEQLRDQETATARAKEHVQVLEEYLGNPEIAVHALVYFQLRAVWRTAGARLGRFAEQLRQQQTDREQRRQVIEFDQTRRRELADFDRRIHDARSRRHARSADQADGHEVAAMRGLNYFRRRRRPRIQTERAQWDQAATLVTDLSDDRTNLEETPPPSSRHLRRWSARRQHGGDRVCAAAGDCACSWWSGDAGEGDDVEASVRRALRQSHRLCPPDDAAS
jgi:hypothetical protein